MNRWRRWWKEWGDLVFIVGVLAIITAPWVILGMVVG